MSWDLEPSPGVKGSKFLKWPKGRKKKIQLTSSAQSEVNWHYFTLTIANQSISTKHSLCLGKKNIDIVEISIILKVSPYSFSFKIEWNFQVEAPNKYSLASMRELKLMQRTHPWFGFFMAPQGLRTRVAVPVSWGVLGCKSTGGRPLSPYISFVWKKQYFTGNVEGVGITESFRLDKISKIIESSI